MIKRQADCLGVSRSGTRCCAGSRPIMCMTAGCQMTVFHKKSIVRSFFMDY